MPRVGRGGRVPGSIQKRSSKRRMSGLYIWLFFLNGWTAYYLFILKNKIKQNNDKLFNN
jgi:hypothetical protein